MVSLEVNSSALLLQTHLSVNYKSNSAKTQNDFILITVEKHLPLL